MASCSSRAAHGLSTALLGLLVQAGCDELTSPQAGPRSQADSKAEPVTAAPPAAAAKAAPGSATAQAQPPAVVTKPASMGTISPSGFPIGAWLGRAPAEIEAEVDEPLGKGMARKSCVRFVPERTWFSCRFALQRYGSKDPRYKAVTVEYQDGKASALAFEGLNLGGPFDIERALSFVGLSLPDAPKLEHPAPDTTLYSWFNSQARLVIDKRQYRVRVSVIDGTWDSTKVEVILNDVLSDDEKARVLPRSAAPPDDEPDNAR